MKIITDITHTRGYQYEDNNGYNTPEVICMKIITDITHQRLSV
jgi:hypothetical protein